MCNTLRDTRWEILRDLNATAPTKRFGDAIEYIDKIRVNVEVAADQFEREFPHSSTLANSQGVPMLDTTMCEVAVARFFELLFDSYYIFWKHEALLLPFFEEYLQNVEARISNIIKPEDLKRLKQYYCEQCAIRKRAKDENHLLQVRRVREALKEDFPKRKRVENVEEATITFVQVHHSSIVHAVDEDDDDDDDEATQPPPDYVEEEEEDAQEPATKKIKKEM